MFFLDFSHGITPKEVSLQNVLNWPTDCYILTQGSVPTGLYIYVRTDLQTRLYWPEDIYMLAYITFYTGLHTVIYWPTNFNILA